MHTIGSRSILEVNYRQHNTSFQSFEFFSYKTFAILTSSETKENIIENSSRVIFLYNNVLFGSN